MKNLAFGRYYQSWIGDLNHQQISEGSKVAYDFKTGPEAFKIGIEMSLFDSARAISCLFSPMHLLVLRLNKAFALQLF